MPLVRYLVLIDTLARYSLKADARRYFFGYLWWVIEPLLYVAVFYLVFDKLLGTNQSDYLAFLVVGKLVFVWFSKSVIQSSNSLMQSRGLIGQRNMPKAVFPLAVLHEGFYKQMPVFLLMLAFLAMTRHQPEAAWLWMPLLILVQYFVIATAALFGALLVSLQRDFVIIVNLGMILMLFVSGVFWDVGSIPNPGAGELLLLINPMAFLLDAYRVVLLYGDTPDIAHLLTLGFATAISFVALLIVFRRLNFWLANRVLSQ